MSILFATTNGNFTDPNVFNISHSSSRTGNYGNGQVLPEIWTGQNLTVKENASNTWVNLSAYTMIALAVQVSAVFDPTATLDVCISGNDGFQIYKSYPLTNFMQTSSKDTYWANRNYHTLSLGTPYQFSRIFTAGASFAMKTSVSGALALYGSDVTNVNKFLITDTQRAPQTDDIIYIAGVHDGSVMNPLTLNFDNPAGNDIDTFVASHGATVNFDNTKNVVMNIKGQGISLNSGSTLNIGPVPANLKHIINFVGGTFYVGDYATLSAAGSPKRQYAKLTNSIANGLTSFSTVENISDWEVGDVISIIPNDTYGTLEEIKIANIANSTTFSINSSNPTKNYHFDYPEMPHLFNMTRNVKILTDISRAFRASDNSKVNLQNVQLRALAPFYILTRDNGVLNLDSCTMSACKAGYETFYFETYSGRPKGHANINVTNCNFNDFPVNTNGLNFYSVTADNINFTNNVFIQPKYNGFYFEDFYSRKLTFKNNYVIGAPRYGAYLLNCSITGSFGGSFNLNGWSGVRIVQQEPFTHILSGVQAHYNDWHGMQIIAPPSALSALYIHNSRISNNKLTGVVLSSSTTNYLKPYKVNIGNMVSYKNEFAGIELSNIYGTISSSSFINNYVYNIVTTIGNGEMLFDNVSSTIETKPLNLTYTYNGTGYKGYSGNSPFPDNSDGYVEFDGLYDYLTFNPYTSANYSISGNDFTIEGFFYPTNTTSTNDQIIVAKANASTVGPFYIAYKNGRLVAGFSSFPNTGYNDLTYGWNINHPDTGLTFGTPTPSAWNHFAFVRRGTKFAGFLNGNREAEFSAVQPLVANPSDGVYPSIGGSSNGGYKFRGKISSVRIVNGYSVYSPYVTNITVPIKSFDLVQDTTMLWKYPYNVFSNYLYSTCPPNQNTSSLCIAGGYSYYPVTISNSTLESNSVVTNISGSGSIELRNTTFENFSIDRSKLKTTNLAIKGIANLNKLQGSYSFYNCTMPSSSINPYLLSTYQTESVLDNGFTSMKENNITNNNYKVTASGKKSADTVITYNGSSVSEKLEPYNKNRKLKSSIKLVPLNVGDSYKVSVNVRKSARPNYTGDAPRLVIRYNDIETVIATSVAPLGVWEPLLGIIPKAKDQSIIEVYVDCASEANTGYINIDNWGLVKI